MRERWKPRFRFSLRAVMLMTAIVAVLIWAGESVRRARQAEERRRSLVAFRQARLVQAQKHLAWAERMRASGYLTSAQVEAERQAVDKERSILNFILAPRPAATNPGKKP